MISNLLISTGPYEDIKARKKKVLLKFLSDYHPDKNAAKDHGEKWQVLAEEITKLVTAHYERLK